MTVRNRRPIPRRGYVRPKRPAGVGGGVARRCRNRLSYWVNTPARDTRRGSPEGVPTAEPAPIGGRRSYPGDRRRSLDPAAPIWPHLRIDTKRSLTTTRRVSGANGAASPSSVLLLAVPYASGQVGAGAVVSLLSRRRPLPARGARRCRPLLPPPVRPRRSRKGVISGCWYAQLGDRNGSANRGSKPHSSFCTSSKVFEGCNKPYKLWEGAPMAHIKKRIDRRADGSTYTRWRARLPNPNRNGGASAKVERTFATKREAERWLTAQQSRVNRGEWIDPALGNLSLGAVAAEWEATWRLDGLAPKTRAGYRSILRKHVLPAFGGARITNVTTDAIQAWLGELSAEREPNTVRRVYTVLRNVFKVAVERRYIGANPCDGVRFRSLRGPQNGASPDQGDVRVIVTEAEARALADAIEPLYRPLVLVAAYSGARAGELRALRRRDVDPLRGQLHVRRAVKEVTYKEAAEEREGGAEVYGNLVFGPTKTYERRRITLPPWLMAVLDEHLATRPASPNALVFATATGEPIRQSNFYRRHFKPAVRAVLPEEDHGLRFHDLRHSHASWLIAGGANVLQVMKRLGHRDIRTTMNTYGHVFPSDEEALAGMFPAEVPTEGGNIRKLRAGETGASRPALERPHSALG